MFLGQRTFPEQGVTGSNPIRDYPDIWWSCLFNQRSHNQVGYKEVERTYFTLFV